MKYGWTSDSTPLHPLKYRDSCYDYTSDWWDPGLGGNGDLDIPFTASSPGSVTVTGQLLDYNDTHPVVVASKDLTFDLEP